ncbi:MAG: DUF378 domain-containing protein [Rickettsiales bacterium]|jgi:uncharacterized membrane protein YuzA (DUF378 family)|nr:DUF378 domain-containing protein [Rickettsiales bacterium]
MKKIINMVALPIALFGAVNYGLIGLFGLDLLGYLDSSALVQFVQIIIGLAGVAVAFGFASKK